MIPNKTAIYFWNARELYLVSSLYFRWQNQGNLTLMCLDHDINPIQHGGALHPPPQPNIDYTALEVRMLILSAFS